MIEKNQIKEIKSVSDMEEFETLLMETMHAVKYGRSEEFIVPVNRNEDGEYEFAVVEAEEEDLQNLSEAWDEIKDAS